MLDMGIAYGFDLGEVENLEAKSISKPTDLSLLVEVDNQPIEGTGAEQPKLVGS